ncbi:MAG TPA: cupin domain-containing protein [Methylomirabilota bacterium]|nr:cupin domain-containing protein [Methylomirabilota bacterium]
MPVVNNDTIQHFQIPGLDHQTLAGPEHGFNTLEMWMQTIAPGAGTPVHRHDCEEAIVVLRGSGQCTIEGVTTNFGPNSTLQIPRNIVHQIVNTGTEDLFIVAALGQAPVRVCTADNEHMPLPWQTNQD